jgi:Holliday junction resolvase RusA-like endonuclease
MIRFEVPGEPVAKSRPRIYTNKFTGLAHGVTPAKTVNYENLVKTYAQEAMGENCQVYFDGEALRMWVTAYFGIPKSTPKKKTVLMAQGTIRPTKKPDADNIGKIVADALNGICYKDDSQIVTFVVEKRYALIPKVTVSIQEVELT